MIKTSIEILIWFYKQFISKGELYDTSFITKHQVARLSIVSRYVYNWQFSFISKPFTCKRHRVYGHYFCGFSYGSRLVTIKDQPDNDKLGQMVDAMATEGEEYYIGKINFTCLKGYINVGILNLKDWFKQNLITNTLSTVTKYITKHCILFE